MTFASTGSEGDPSQGLGEAKCQPRGPTRFRVGTLHGAIPANIVFVQARVCVAWCVWCVVSVGASACAPTLIQASRSGCCGVECAP